MPWGNMDKAESETDEEMLQNGKKAYEVLQGWATSGTHLAYSAGTYGFHVQGTIRPMREPENDAWGIFEAIFIFFSRTREITAYVHMMPGMKILTKPSGEVRALEFGAGACTLRPVAERKPHPDDLRRVVVQLNAWVEGKMKVWVYLDLGFSALGSVCDIEAVNAQSFALTEEGGSRTYFAVPEFSARASIEDLEGVIMVRLTSEDRKSELLLAETSINREDLMARMISKMVH